MTMASKRNKYYFCHHLRAVHLLWILFRFILHKYVKVIIYCTAKRPNKLAAFIEKNNKLFSKLFINRIIIKGFIGDAPAVINHLPGILCQKVDIDKLYEVAHEIDKEMLQVKDSPLNFLDKKLSGLRNEIGLYVKHWVAFDVRDDLLLVETAKQILKNPQSTFCGTDLTLLIDKKNYWGRFAIEYANKENIPFLTFNKFVLRSNMAVQFFFYVIQLFVEYASSLFKRKEPQSQKTIQKIGIPYYLHKNITEFFEKRNYYLFWYPESGIDPKRIIIYADGVADISIEEKRRIDNLGFTILSCNSFFKKRVNFIQRYKCSFRAIKLFFDYIRQSMGLLARIRTRLAFEQWKILAVLFVKLPYWQDFFTKQNIKIKFRFHNEFSHRDIAAHLSGAATMSYNYSNYSTELFSILDHDICDIYFVWGEEQKKCFLSKYSNVKNIIYIGYIFDYTFTYFNKKSEYLKSSLADKGNNFLIAFMDENMIGGCREDILSLYNHLFRFLLDNPGVNLLIKPKKDITRKALESSVKTSGFFSLLEKEGRVRLLESSKYPVEVGKASDLVIGVLANSTAALECSLAGVPVIIYECFFPEQQTESCYRHGRNKIIFNDFQVMADAIQAYRLNKDRSNGFADWSGLLGERDSFRDGKANKRIGFYIKTLLNKFDSGFTKNAAIKETNRIYGDKFGDDKVISLM